MLTFENFTVSELKFRKLISILKMMGTYIYGCSNNYTCTECSSCLKFENTNMRPAPQVHPCTSILPWTCTFGYVHVYLVMILHCFEETQQKSVSTFNRDFLKKVLERSRDRMGWLFSSREQPYLKVFKFRIAMSRSPKSPNIFIEN